MASRMAVCFRGLCRIILFPPLGITLSLNLLTGCNPAAFGNYQLTQFWTPLCQKLNLLKEKSGQTEDVQLYMSVCVCLSVLLSLSLSLSLSPSRLLLCQRPKSDCQSRIKLDAGIHSLSSLISSSLPPLFSSDPPRPLYLPPRYRYTETYLRTAVFCFFQDNTADSEQKILLYALSVQAFVCQKWLKMRI